MREQATVARASRDDHPVGLYCFPKKGNKKKKDGITEKKNQII
jgi:hypothetical protein